MSDTSQAKTASQVSRTSTKRRVWRRTGERAAWWPWGLLPIVGLAVLFLFGAAVMAPDIQAEVRSNVGQQLSSAGVAVGAINADGQRVRARVGETNYDETTLAALGEAARCETWAGTLRCPSVVTVERDTAAAAPAVATRRPHAFEMAVARAPFDDAQAAGRAGSFDDRTLDADAPGAQACDKRFADILSDTSIRFRTSSARIETASEPLLADLADIARDCPGRLTIAGHTDSRGDAAMNEALSMARAAAVRDAFVRLGIDAERVTAVGFGESQPIADNASPEGRARNRRIAISMDPKN